MSLIRVRFDKTGKIIMQNQYAFICLIQSETLVPDGIFYQDSPPQMVSGAQYHNKELIYSIIVKQNALKIRLPADHLRALGSTLS